VFCMIFALAIIGTATLAATTFAMSLVGWMLGLGLFLGQVHRPAGDQLDDEAQASGATP
jgi:hypothetical protein